MKIFIIVLALLGVGFIALRMTEHSTPLPTQAAEAVQPLAKKFAQTMSGTVNDFLAGTEGPVGDGARRNQQKTAAAEAQLHRTTRKSMADCLKPGHLIDQDVKECMDGTRAKDW